MFVSPVAPHFKPIDNLAQVDRQRFPDVEEHVQVVGHELLGDNLYLWVEAGNAFYLCGDEKTQRRRDEARSSRFSASFQGVAGKGAEHGLSSLCGEGNHVDAGLTVVVVEHPLFHHAPGILLCHISKDKDSYQQHQRF